jgi:hypothetical protein
VVAFQGAGVAQADARTEGEAFARNTFLLVSLGTGILAAMLLWVRSRL